MFALSLVDFLSLLLSPSTYFKIFYFCQKYHLKDTYKIFKKISCGFEIWMGFVGPKLIKLWTSSIWGFLKLPLWWTLGNCLCKHAGYHSVTTGACSPPHLTCLGLCSMAAWKLNGSICAMPASQRAFGKLHQQCNFFRPTQNYRHFQDDMIKCIFLNANIWISILKFIPEGPIESFTR